MLKKSFRGKAPILHPTVRAAETAAVIGDVRCGAQVSLWYGAVVRADTDTITIGENTNVQDGCILHCDKGVPLTIGKNCTLGHGAIVHGCTVGEGTLVGMGATLLNGCTIGKNCIIGANALVTSGTNIPDGWLAMGVPAKAVRPVTEEELGHSLENLVEYLELSQAQLPSASGVFPEKL
jgi:carbonic anhydrase/acetyltransferase-like protein (isoleucine patch superfamily)